MTTTYLQNGQVLTSTALSQTDMEGIFQTLLCQCLGIMADLPLQCSVVTGNPVIQTPLVAVNLQLGFIAEAPQIPEGTTIVEMNGVGTNLAITLSANPTATAVTNVLFSDPNSNTAVRISWPERGAPGFSIDSDWVFLKINEVDNPYNLIRDESWAPQSEYQLEKSRFYTRVWQVSLSAYGPNCFDNVRIFKSLFLEDFTSDSLQGNNLAVVSALGASTRSPELFQGQWWDRSDFSFQVYERVTETINVPLGKSVQIIGSTDTGQSFGATATLGGNV